MIAVLNDGAILSIAYDKVHYSDRPETWNMRLVLGISTVLGVIGVLAAFGLFYLAERVFHLDRAHAQTLMYLKLSVAGHLTIFLTRTRGPFWSIRPARILWIAVLGTQTVATLIAVYGLFMTPLGWRWAGFVWVYALAWALVNDRVKLLAYKIFDPIKADLKSETKTDPQPEVKADSKREEKAEAKPEVKTEAEPEAEAEAEPKPEVKAPSDLTPQIAKRAYELYEQRARKDGRADQDWKKAEQEIRKPETKTEPKPETKTEPKPEAATEPKPKDVIKPATQTKTATKPEAKAEPIAEGKNKSPSDLTPQLVKRVHEVYEDLGRKEVQEVEEWEKAKRKTS
ncbi:MAG: DUF2934 domain-containing protein [Candidatus Sulfotelmatobacter sp.]